MKKRKVFLIHPVRNITEELKQRLDDYRKRLEKEGYGVYDPLYHTNQVDPTGGYRIFVDNMNAIKNADEVHIAWDGVSQGSLFDMGVAFALGKPVKRIPLMFPEPEKSVKKSVAHVVKVWEEKGKRTKTE
jgi:nucleoside 2-deoxyribosyltransferase